jgi:hypothetical protein
MKATKEKLIVLLDEKVFVLAENHPQVTETIKRKVRTTRMRLNNLTTPVTVIHRARMRNK